MIRLLFFFLSFHVLFACTKKQGRMSPASYTPQAISAPAKTYLAHSDSYTIGQGVTESQRFPQKTVDWLRTNGINMVVLNYIATTG